MKTKKINVGIVVWLSVLFLLLASCSEDEIAQQAEKEKLSLQFSIGDYPPFTYQADTRAVIGTPDVGKTKWEAGDKLLVKVSLFKEATTTDTPLKDECIEFTYDGYVWKCTFGSLSIEPYKDQYGKYQRYKAARITGYYMPTDQWSKGTDDLYTLSPGNIYDYGTREAFSAQKVEMINSEGLVNIGVTLNFTDQMTPRLYSRLRVVTTKGDIVTLTGVGFTTATDIAQGYSTRKWVASSFARVSADNNGNAFYYGKWDSYIQFKVKIERLNEGILPTFIKEKSFDVPSASVNGMSYVIDMR